MADIKQVIDLLTGLSKRHKDRQFAAELLTIQRLVLDIQRDHQALGERNQALLAEVAALKAAAVPSAGDSQSRPSSIPAPAERLESIAEELLSLLAASGESEAKDHYHNLRVGVARGDYLVDLLKERGFVLQTDSYFGFLGVTAAGRKYLATYDLLQ